MKSIAVRTIARCNELFAAKTLHPFVSVIRLSDPALLPASIRFGFYTVWLKGADFGSWAFGRQSCDFSEGTLVSLRPGQRLGKKWRELQPVSKDGSLLCFHPSLIDPRETDIFSEGYTFFRYAGDEALHLSGRERRIMERALADIEEELDWGVDEYSYTILRTRIMLLLDYVSRFYRRQFILRHEANRQLIDRADRWLETFFLSGRARCMLEDGPSFFSRQFGCSSAYFNDLLKVETGKDADEYFKCKQILLAEELLKRGDQSVQTVASELGFPSDRAFCVLFQRLKGETPAHFIRDRRPRSSGRPD